jgi:adenylate cyclase
MYGGTPDRRFIVRAPERREGHMSEADEGGPKRRTVYPGIAAIMAIAIGVNALGVLSIDPLASLMIESDVLAAIDAISSHGLARFLNVILPFSLFGIFLLFYLLPIAHAFSGRKRADPQSIKVARRLLRTPTVIALVTGAAWLVSLPVVVIGWSMLDFDLESRFYLQYTMHSLTLFGFSFVIAYYGVEVIVQRYIAPRVFSGNQALQVGSRFALPIGARLFVLAGSAFFLPGLVFYTAIRILNNGGDNHFGRDLLPILETALLVMGGLITLIAIFKSLSIVAPIVELTEATRKIGKGDLGSRITVRSVDRIGELGGAFNDMAAGLAERERERSIFGRVVDPRVRDRLLEKTESGNGELRRATVVFFDLAGFTALSEHLPPGTVVAILNSYFQTVAGCVEAEGGLVNKFIGDGVLAVFGAPDDQPDHALRAMRTIESLGARMKSLNDRLGERGYRPLRVRAGAHTGELMAGVVGSKTRQEYTVIGDAVNTASRLESLAKEQGVDAIISAQCWEEAGRDGSWTHLGRITVRGKTEPLGVFGKKIDQANVDL